MKTRPQLLETHLSRNEQWLLRAILYSVQWAQNVWHPIAYHMMTSCHINSKYQLELSIACNSLIWCTVCLGLTWQPAAVQQKLLPRGRRQYQRPSQCIEWMGRKMRKSQMQGQRPRLGLQLKLRTRVLHWERKGYYWVARQWQSLDERAKEEY